MRGYFFLKEFADQTRINLTKKAELNFLAKENGKYLHSGKSRTKKRTRNHSFTFLLLPERGGSAAVKSYTLELRCAHKS